MVTGWLVMVACVSTSGIEKNRTSYDDTYVTQAQCEAELPSKQMAEFDLKFKAKCHAKCVEIVEGEQ